MPGQGGHHRADVHSARGLSDRPEQDPRIGHRHAVIDDDVVPDEEPVPARLLGDDRKVDQQPGLRVRSEVREVEAESHPAKAI